MSEQARDGRRSLAAMAVAMAIAVGAITLGVALDVSGGSDVVVTGPRETAREDGLGLCVTVADGMAGTDAAALEAMVLAEARARPHMFPEVTVVTAAPAADDAGSMTAIGAWPFVASERHQDALASQTDDTPCRATSSGWTAAVTMDLLADGADAILAAEQLSEGWSGSVAVTVEPDRSVVHTELTFTGPLGIGGHCWIDETVTIDPATSTIVLTAESGNDAGLAGLVACRRFEDSMVEGGAGGQAMALLTYVGSGQLVGGQRFAVESVEVGEEAIVLSGSVTR